MILTIKAMYSCRNGRRYGLVTMCIGGGGRAFAAIIERL